MPRALSRDEQLVHNYVRRHAASVPVPAVAEELGLSETTTADACAYLVERGLLRVSIYAVAPPAAKGAAPEPAALAPR
ncbi:MAG: hypothetical protein ACYDCQ_14625 [Dehalococcoidia bacterium]